MRSSHIPLFEAIPESIRTVTAGAAVLGALAAGPMATASAAENNAATVSHAVEISRVVANPANVLPQSVSLASSTAAPQTHIYSNSVVINMPNVRDAHSSVDPSSFNANKLMPILTSTKNFVTAHQADKPVVTVTIDGISSDEYTASGPNAELGIASKPNTANDLVAKNYAAIAKMGTILAIDKQNIQVADSNYTVKSHQIILTTDQIHNLDQTRQKLGFDNFQDELRAQKANPKLGGAAIAQQYDEYITKNQGAIITVAVQTTTEAPAPSTSDSPSSSPSATPIPSSTIASVSAAEAGRSGHENSTADWAVPLGVVAVGLLVAGAVIARRRRNRNIRTTDPAPRTAPPTTVTAPTSATGLVTTPPPVPILPPTSRIVPPAGAQANNAPSIDPLDDNDPRRPRFLRWHRRKQNP